MIRGALTLLAVEDAEFSRIQLSTDTIIVDPYNVQTEPLVIKVELVSGANVSSASAYISTQAVSIGKPISGAVKDFGLCSKTEFTIPAKDKLYATATAIRVDSYSDAGKKNLIESKTVNVVCNQIPEPLYRGEKWASTMFFRNGDFLEHEVNGSKSIYQWSSRVDGNTSKAPWDIKLTTDPEYGYWEHVTEKTLFAAKVLLVKNALIGSAVFNKDYTISQQGVVKVPGKTYKDFEETMSMFEPNIVINWLTGKIRALEMEILGNSRFGGILDAVTGTFKSLICEDKEGRKFEIKLGDGEDARPGLAVYNQNKRKVAELTFDDNLANDARLILTRYHENKDGSADVTNSTMIHSNGIVEGDTSDNSFQLSPTGLVFSKKSSSGFMNESNRYHFEREILELKGGEKKKIDNADFIRVQEGHNVVTLPLASACVGRMIYFKITSGDVTLKTVGGNTILGPSEWQPKSEYNINATYAFMVKSDGAQWCIFRGW